MRAVRHFVTLILASQALTAMCASSSSDVTPAATTTQSSSCKSALTGSYAQAVVAYPHLKDAIEIVAAQPIAQWFTDRLSDPASVAKTLFQSKCSAAATTTTPSAPPTIVVYGLPDKDCGAGFSSSGSNTNAAEYRAFLQLLVDQAQNQAVVYILEPDAVGLLADSGCGNASGYATNLALALELLSTNPNADIYIDIGYWTLSDDAKATAVAKIVRDIDTAGKCKGIALNTSNYRSVAEMQALCDRFARVSGKEYRCIVDTSRNFVAPTTAEWCNTKETGMGLLPTSSTGSDLIDYYVWVKPPGESDGECTGQTAASLTGPSAGSFFADHFIQLWNNGVFVKEQGLSTLDSNGYTTATTSVQTSSSYDSSPSVAPSTTTATPYAVAPTVASDSTPTTTTPVPTTVEYTIAISGDEYQLEHSSSSAGDSTDMVDQVEAPGAADDAEEEDAEYADEDTAAESNSDAYTSEGNDGQEDEGSQGASVKQRFSAADPDETMAVVATSASTTPWTSPSVSPSYCS